MRSRVGLCGALMLMAIAFCSPARAEDRVSLFQRDMVQFLERLRQSGEESTPPGFVVIATDGKRVLFERPFGVRDSATGAPMTLDTPIYNASITKAYTGLLASVLDERAVLPLETSLRDIWPEISLAAPLDPGRIDARQLLSHTSGIRAGGIIYRSAWTGDIKAQDVPLHLSRFAQFSQAGFSYSNTGPFVYSAMMEARTGVSWRSAINRYVLEPMRLRRTIATLEDLPESDIAHCHGWLGGRWKPLAHKPTVTMNASGGMYASGRDTALFLQAFLSDGRSTRGRMSASALRRTWLPAATQSRDLWGMHRDGYGLGWDLGTIGGRRFVSRAGGFSGCRAIMLFLPNDNFAVAVLSVGDISVASFNATIVAQAVDLWTNRLLAKERLDKRIAEYAQTATAERARVASIEASLPADLPIDASYAHDVLGQYENARLGRIQIQLENHRLVGKAGAFAASLRRVKGDRFLFLDRDEVEFEDLAFQRAEGGAVTGFVWDGELFERTQ